MDANGGTTGATKDTEYYSRHPLEHEDSNSLVRDNKTCKDTSDRSNLDKCDKLDPDSIETVYERKTENNEKTEHGESGHHETPSVQPAPDLADANLRATNNGQDGIKRVATRDHGSSGWISDHVRHILAYSYNLEIFI